MKDEGVVQKHTTLYTYNKSEDENSNTDLSEILTPRDSQCLMTTVFPQRLWTTVVLNDIKKVRNKMSTVTRGLSTQQN